LRLGQWPLSIDWEAVHHGVEPGRRFVDEQVRGPFARWAHTHAFEADGPSASILEDRIEFELPGGVLGDRVLRSSIESRLDRLFVWRHAVTRSDLERHREAQLTGALRVAVTGSSGLIGSALVPFLTTGGHRVVRVVRSGAGPEDVTWSPGTGGATAAPLEGVDAVVHLAGRGIAASRWTPGAKAEILRSRVEGTRLLATALAQLERPPSALICASAVGYYGDRGEEPIDEGSDPGEGFLADVTRAWESAADPARQRGIRVVHLRFGVVLSAAGGALRRMLLPFRAGLGGRVGTGRQWMSWISLDDAIGAILFAIARGDVEGPLNAVSPEPVPNAEFTRVLGRVLRRPAVLPLPAPVVRMLFGEMGQALLLQGQRVAPGRLSASGFRFHHPRLEAALRYCLGRMVAR
jgi:hypothetical protein